MLLCKFNNNQKLNNMPFGDIYVPPFPTYKKWLREDGETDRNCGCQPGEARVCEKDAFHLRSQVMGLQREPRTTTTLQ